MDAVEEIKSRLSIEDVVGRYVELKRSGSSYKGLCPFHQEKTPSFHVTPSRGTFHCFGCGKGGDIFTFVQEVDRVQFPEALARLAEQAGVTLPERTREGTSLRKKLVEVNEAAVGYFRESLASAQGDRARSYLSARTFGPEATDRFELGYAPAGRDGLVQHLRAGGFDDRLILSAGLAIQDDIGGQPRDRFRGRVIFPIRDGSRRVTGFGGRALDSQTQPKYLNSPQTEIFDKSAVLYGIHYASEAIRESRRAVLVEGYLDAIRAHAAGYHNVVASLGTAVTRQQLSALSRLADTVTVALDPDPAGQAAAVRTSLMALAEITRQRGRASGAPAVLDLRIAQLPKDHGDPDELIRDEAALWEATIAASIPAFDFFFSQTMASLDRSSDIWKQGAIDRLLPVIQEFSTSTDWQASWIQRLADETKIDPKDLQRTLPGPTAARRPRPRTAEVVGQRDSIAGTTTRALAANAAIEVEKKLLAMLLRLVVIPADAASALSGAPIELQEHRSILDALLAWRETGNYDFQMFLETLPQDVSEVAVGLHEINEPVPADGRIALAVEYYLTRLRHFRLLGQLRRASEAVSEMGAEDEPGARSNLATLLGAKHDVEADLDRLSRDVAQARAQAHGTMDHDSGS